MIAESSSPSVTSLPRSLPEVSTVPGEGHFSVFSPILYPERLLPGVCCDNPRFYVPRNSTYEGMHCAGRARTLRRVSLSLRACQQIQNLLIPWLEFKRFGEILNRTRWKPFREICIPSTLEGRCRIFPVLRRFISSDRNIKIRNCKIQVSTHVR